MACPGVEGSPLIGAPLAGPHPPRQALKKFYGAEAAVASGCNLVWLLDAESYAFRRFSFASDVFGRYVARPLLHIGAPRPEEAAM